MKKLTHDISQAILLILIFLAMSAQLALSQNQFIIGAEWLNKPEQPTGQPHIPNRTLFFAKNHFRVLSALSLLNNFLLHFPLLTLASSLSTFGQDFYYSSLKVLPPM